MSSIRSVSLLWLGSIIGAGMAFLSQVLLARSLGPIAYGEFSAALTLTTTLAPLAAFGVPAFLLRVLATDHTAGTRWVRPALHFSYLSTLAVTVSAIVWALFAPHSQTIQNTLFILAIQIPYQAALELFILNFQIKDKYSKIGLLQGAPHLLRALFILATATLFYDVASDKPYFYAIAFAFPSILLLLLSARGIQEIASLATATQGASSETHFSRVENTQCASTKWSVFILSAPFGIGTLLHLLYFQSGIIFLSYFSDSESTANFSINVYVLSAIYLLPSVLFQRYLQKRYHIQAHQNPETVRSTIIRTISYSSLFGILLAAVLIAAGRNLIPAVFGSEYHLAGEISAFMALAIPLRMISMCLGTFLQTRDHVATKVKCMAAVATLTVLLLATLVPNFGVHGAVVATLFSEIALVTLYALFSLRYFP